MMIGTQNRYLNQCKYEPCEKTQLLPCYKVLHAHHLPSILINHGSVERPLTVSGMPSKSSIPHFAKNVKQPHHCRSVPVGGAAVLLPCSRATARLYYYNSIDVQWLDCTAAKQPHHPPERSGSDAAVWHFLQSVVYWILRAYLKR